MIHLGIVLVFPVLLMAAGISFGQDSGSLDENSPFVPSGFNPKNKAGPKTKTARSSQRPQFEFQGFYQIGDSWMFSILNKSTNQSEWVGLNDSSSSYQVSHFDPDTNTVSFDFQNTPQELTLRKRSDTSIPVILAKKIQQPKRRVPVRRKVNPKLPKNPPTAPPTAGPSTPPPNFNPPPLPTSIAERRALARKTAISSLGGSSARQGMGRGNNSLFNASNTETGGLPSGINGPPASRPPSAPPPGPPPGARPPRKN